MASSSCVRLAAVHPYHQHQTYRKTKLTLPSPTYVHAFTSSPTGPSCSFPNTLLITQKYRPQFLSPKTLQQPNFLTSKNTVCTAAALCENSTSISENTPKIPATEICILVFVYIVPFLNRLNLPSKFPVLKYATSPIMPLLGLYQSIPTLGLVGFLALFICFVRYRNSTKFKYSFAMDCVVVIASLVRPFLLNSDPLAVGALGFKFQLLNVLELLGFQTCIHSCSEYLGAVQCAGELEKVHEEEEKKISEEEEKKVTEEEEKKVNVAADVSDPFIDKLVYIVKVVLRTDGNEGRRQGKSMVLKLIRDHDSLRSNVICNKNILSSCESCLNSLLNLCEIAAKNYVNRKNEIALEVDNLLWLVDILVDWQAGEEFARMWANQQVLANLLMKYWYRIEFENSCHSINCITARLLVNIGNGKILPEKNTRQLLLKTWFWPLANDYSYLRKVKSFDQKVVEENIERMILELTPEDQQSILLAWLEYFMKNGIDCPDLRKGFEGWCRGNTSQSVSPS